jgi:hypothetical protein
VDKAEFQDFQPLFRSPGSFLVKIPFVWDMTLSSVLSDSDVSPKFSILILQGSIGPDLLTQEGDDTTLSRNVGIRWPVAHRRIPEQRNPRIHLCRNVKSRILMNFCTSHSPL